MLATINSELSVFPPPLIKLRLKYKININFTFRFVRVLNWVSH